MSAIYLSKDEVHRDTRKVVDFCADEIRAAAGVPRKRPLNANEIHNAAVNKLLELVEVQEQIKLTDGEEELAELYQNQDELATELETVMVQAGTSEKRKGRTRVHEMATKLQRTEVAQKLYDVDFVICKYLDGRRVRHDNAVRVEQEVGFEFFDGEHAEF